MWLLLPAQLQKLLMEGKLSDGVVMMYSIHFLPPLGA
jgi:hypothetical protein